MDFATSIKTVLTKYADFNGRARRSEFWWWFLAVVIVDIVTRALGVGVLSLLISLAILVPNLAVGSRRLHDTGKSGWLQLIALTIIGIIPLIVFFAQDSTPGDNKYGPNPKGVGGGQPMGGYGMPPAPPAV
jgi:uncharacterized membrane protein YhaH (DUF805 family)